LPSTTKLEPVLGASSAAALAAAFDIHTVRDLLRHYPRRYAERGELTPTIAGLEIRRARHGHGPGEDGERAADAGPQRLESGCGDHRRHRTLDCKFFNQRWQKTKLEPGHQRVCFAGKGSRCTTTKLQLTKPGLPPDDGDATMPTVPTVTRPRRSDEFLGLNPVYPATAKLQSWQIAKCVRHPALRHARRHRGRAAGPTLRARHRLADYAEAIKAHSTWPGLACACRRPGSG
jgi:ATP-dependent DNA helicase RecG